MPFAFIGKGSLSERKPGPDTSEVALFHARPGGAQSILISN